MIRLLRRWRRRRLAEQGRKLASQREDLIAQGADPADLVVPMAPIDEDDWCKRCETYHAWRHQT